MNGAELNEGGVNLDWRTAQTLLSYICNVIFSLRECLGAGNNCFGLH